MVVERNVSKREQRWLSTSASLSSYAVFLRAVKNRHTFDKGSVVKYRPLIHAAKVAISF